MQSQKGNHLLLKYDIKFKKINKLQFTYKIKRKIFQTV